MIRRNSYFKHLRKSAVETVVCNVLNVPYLNKNPDLFNLMDAFEMQLIDPQRSPDGLNISGSYVAHETGTEQCELGIGLIRPKMLHYR